MVWMLVAVIALLVMVGVLRALSEAGVKHPDPPGMRTIANFQAPEFEKREAAKDENPQSWGEPLLKEVLASVGQPFKVSTEYSRSYGHAAIVEAKDKKFTVMVGFVNENEGWLLFVNGKQELSPLPEAEESRALLRQVHAALAKMNGISDVRWSD